MTAVRDNRAASRFELEADGEIAIAAYERADDTIVFTHTLVPEALSGQGVGSRLITGALDAVRAEGLRVVPACSFVCHFIATHPDYADLA